MRTIRIFLLLIAGLISLFAFVGLVSITVAAIFNGPWWAPLVAVFSSIMLLLAWLISNDYEGKEVTKFDTPFAKFIKTGSFK